MEPPHTMTIATATTLTSSKFSVLMVRLLPEARSFATLHRDRERGPRLRQNRACGGFSCWHRGHCMPDLPAIRAGEGQRDGEARLAPEIRVVKDRSNRTGRTSISVRATRQLA